LETRFPFEPTHHRASSMFETKEILRENMNRVKEQLTSETLRAQSLARDLNDRDAELTSARDALKDTRHRLAESYNQNQKLEKTIQDLRQNARKNSAIASWSNADSAPDTPPAPQPQTAYPVASANCALVAPHLRSLKHLLHQYFPNARRHLPRRQSLLPITTHRPTTKRCCSN
jgi:hypothetical protein